ncbi:MAG: DUF6502 family protein [Pseudomonadota bacterium]
MGSDDPVYFDRVGGFSAERAYVPCMTSHDPSPPGSPFLRVLRGLLRPLVKAMIAQGVTAPAVYRLLKEVYVEVADSAFRLDDKRPTDSRISLLTGVHRKDVRTIREAASEARPAGSARVTALASVIGRWLASPETVDAEGNPLPLPRQAAEGPSFDALVESVSKDVRPRTVLDELLRQDLVRVDPGTEVVHLSEEAFLGPGDGEQQVVFFAQNVGDHIAAATENLLAKDDTGPAPFLERAVFYNRLRTTSIDRLEAEARNQAGEGLAALNRMAFTFQQEDMDAPDATERFRYGVYFYRAPETEVPEPGVSGEDGGDDKGGTNDQT